MIRRKLVETRKKRGYSQQEMAKFLNIARTTYTGYETGRFAPSLEKGIKIKEILKCKSDDIFEIS